MPPLYWFTIGAWGDVLCGVGGAFAHREWTGRGIFVHYGHDSVVTDFLITQDWCDEALWIKPQSKDEYRAVLRQLSHRTVNDDREYFPILKKLLATTDIDFGRVRLIHFRSRPKIPLPVHHWHNAKLPTAHREWADKIIRRDGVKNILLHPYSFASCKLGDHWPHWRTAINWLQRHTEHRYYLTGAGYSFPIKTDDRFVNLLGHTPTQMHVFALADLCDGIIATSNSLAHWASIRQKPSVIPCNRLCSHPHWYFRRWLEHPQSRALQRHDGVGVFTSGVEQLWGGIKEWKPQVNRVQSIPKLRGRKPSLSASPSVLRQQTPWPTWLIVFPDTRQSICRFNPSLVRMKDRSLWLAARRVIGSKDMFSRIEMWKFDDTERRIQSASLKIVDLGPNGYEDPRLFWHQDSLWLSFIHFQFPRNCRESIARLDEQFNVIEKREPIYGKNRATVFEQVGHEKNWTWFSHDGVLHMIYQMHPTHQIVVMPDGTTPVEIHETNTLEWPWGELRGGASPIRIGDEYFGFFHSSIGWKHRQRRYFMGAYAFEAKPPFKITRLSKEPTLSGTEREPRRYSAPPVVFPCGSILEEGQWTVSFGVNDTECGMIKIPHDELTQTMEVK